MLYVQSALMVCILLASSATVHAQTRVQPLLDALDMGSLIQIMREEGVEYGGELALEMFPGRDGATWRDQVSQIYDVDKMSETISTGMDAELADTDIAPLVAFFTSDLGRQIVVLEVSARRAFLESAVEDAATDQVMQLQDNNDPHFSLIEKFSAASDLIDTNVVGAMNANYAFYQGLAAGGGLDLDLSEEQMLSDVWEQEPEIRQSTTEWVYGYLNMAYQPLSEAELTAYLDLTMTPEGKDMTRALFVSFDEMFINISKALGFAASQFMSGQDL